MNARPLYDNFTAATRAQKAVGKFTYQLGTGDMDTPMDEMSDCCGFATCWAYGIRRHRPGFNHGAWSTVEDDINCNSSIEDAQHARDLFCEISEPAIGALLKYPTIRVKGHDGQWLTFVGHEGIVVDITRAVGKWDPDKPDYSLLGVVQCCGPNGHHPGVILSDGAIWRRHSELWPLPQHRTHMLAVRP